MAFYTPTNYSILQLTDRVLKHPQEKNHNNTNTNAETEGYLLLSELNKNPSWFDGSRGWSVCVFCSILYRSSESTYLFMSPRLPFGLPPVVLVVLLVN